LKIAIIGSRGIPAKYGGFETFVERLSLGLIQKGHQVTVYCSSLYTDNKAKSYNGIERVFIPALPVKSVEKFSTSCLSILHDLFRRADIVLLIGVSPVLISWLPRLLGKKLVINIDGLEWKRAKWNKILSFFLKLSEKSAGTFCQEVVTDSLAIQKYYYESYRKRAAYIPYGADIIKDSNEKVLKKYGLKKGRYILQVCRLEPENNVHLVLREFSKIETDLNFVVLGDNRYNTDYIKSLKKMRNTKIRFLGAVYGDDYKAILKNAYCYVHGHEVGGTNPALLEAMGAGKCVLVLDVPFNLETIKDAGITFSKREGDLANTLQDLIKNPTKMTPYEQRAMERIKTVYNWETVINAYESLFLKVVGRQ